MLPLCGAERVLVSQDTDRQDQCAQDVTKAFGFVRKMEKGGGREASRRICTACPWEAGSRRVAPLRQATTSRTSPRVAYAAVRKPSSTL